jgi:hypothetical protein
MPITSLPLSLLLCSAMGIPLTAMAAVMVDAPDGYSLAGAGLAAFCIVAYLQMKQRSVTVWALIFNVVATAGVGWMSPELVAHYVLRGVEMSNKSWTLLAFLCGLTGGALVSSLIVILNRRVPKAVENLADRLHLPEEEKPKESRDEIKWCRKEEE